MIRHLALPVAFVLLAAAPVAAQQIVVRPEQDPHLDRYEARAIVTGTDMRDRPKGMAQCLMDVLVKVSGDPSLADDPAAVALGAEAPGMVLGFDYWDRMTAYEHHDEQGSYDRPFDLTARFDPAKIDAALHDLGRAPWPDPRPVLLLVAHAQGRGAPLDVLSDEPRAEDMRAALTDTGQKYGITIALPGQRERGTWRARGLPPQAGRVELAGALVFNTAAQGWVAVWHMDWQGRAYDWDIGGVGFDEAFRAGVRGAVTILSGHGAPRD